MPEKELQILIKRFTIFLIVSVIFEFTNLGSTFVSKIGAPQEIVSETKIKEARASGNSYIFLTGTTSTTWTVPNDWSNTTNTIEVIGGGGGGNKGANTSNSGGGGGGGAYAKISNISLTRGASVTIQVGAGGAAAATGTDTWFNGATCAGSSVCAKGGSPGTNGTPGTGGAGGASSTSVGTVVYAGGRGGDASSSATSGGGGGGAAGPNGAGFYTAANTTTTGAIADNGFGGLVANEGNPGANGNSGNEWGGGYGSGGGAGGGNASPSTGGTGGFYGGGGGGGGRQTGNGGPGQQGIIVVTYVPVAPTSSPGTPTYTNVSSTNLTVNWTAATGSASYYLERSTNGNSFSQIANPAGISYNDSGINASTTYWYRVRGLDSTGDVGPYSASSSITTTQTPVITSIAYTVNGDGGRSGDTITITGTVLQAPPAGSRANCSGGLNTGCIQFNSAGGIATTTVADSDITAWSGTSITFNISSSLATLGGEADLQVFASSTGSNLKTFYVYPKITAMATCTNCTANAAREYSASDADGLIMLQGDHFGPATGTILFPGTFGNVTGTIHNATGGACTSAGWKGSATSSNTVCVEVPSTIPNNVYVDMVRLTRNDASSSLGAWATTSTSNLPTSTTAQGGIALNGYIYSIGGNQPGVPTSTDVYYTSSTASGVLNPWKTTQSLPSGIESNGAVSNNGYIYSVGGYIPNTGISTVYYTSSTASGALNPWQTTQSLPVGLETDRGVVSYNGYIYTIGGWVFGTGYIATVYYTSSTASGALNPWQTTAALPIGTAYLSSVAYNGYIYALGGTDANSVNATSSVYYTSSTASGALNPWQTAPPLPNPNELPGAVVTQGGYIYLIGGYVLPDYNRTSTVYYAPSTASGAPGSWVKTVSLSTLLYDEPAVISNGYIYTLGGSGVGTISTIFYTPLGKSDSTSLRILPRILSNTPVSATSGTVIDIKGDHFCESGTCPVSPNRATSADNVKFGSTTSTDSDFQDLTGGAGTCNGTGAAWTDSEICVKVPAASPAGSASTTITSNSSYQSNQMPFTVISSGLPGTPGVPTYSGQASSTPGNVTVNWTAGSGADFYNLQNATGGNGPFAFVASTTVNSYAQTGLVANTTYWYRVQSQNASGTSAWSATSSVLTYPGQPTMNAYANVQTSTLTVNWSLATGGASSTKIERSTDGNSFSQISTTAATTYNDSGLASSTTYWYRVRATNSKGDSIYSASSSVTTAAGAGNSPPNAPSEDAPLNAVQNQLVLPVFKMTATDPNSDKLQYRVVIYSDSACTQAVQTNDQSASQTGWSGQNATCVSGSDCYSSGSQGTYTTQTALAQGTTYWWQASAKDPQGTGNWVGSATCNSFTTTSGNWTTDSGSWSISGNQAVVTPASGASAQMHVAGRSTSTGVIEFKAKSSAVGANTGNIGGVLRGDTGANRYLLASGDFLNQREVIAKTVASAYSTISTLAFTFSADTFYEFRGYISGNSLRSWINGANAISATDSAISGNGFFGLAASSTNGSATFTYDNFAFFTTSTITLGSLPPTGSWAVRDHTGTIVSGCLTSGTWDASVYTGQIPIDYDAGGGSVAVWAGNGTCSGVADITYPATGLATDIFGGDTYTYSTSSIPSCNTNSDSLTTNTVTVTTSTFTRVENTNTLINKTVVSVQVDLVMSYNGTGPEEQYSEEKITTVALRN